MEKHTVYISGRMTGLPRFNYPAFMAAEARLMLRGFAVINPARTGEEDTQHLEQPEWHDYMRSALDRIRHADAIHFLPGWWRSYGAWVEWIVARKMKLKRVWL